MLADQQGVAEGAGAQAPALDAIDTDAARAERALAIVPIHCNTDADRIEANMRSAMARAIPWLQLQDRHAGRLAIVAGGPSLQAHLPLIAAMVRDGAQVLAVNNAAALLRAAGIAPDLHFSADAQLTTARFFGGGIVGAKPPHVYLAASNDPATYDAAIAAGAPVTLCQLALPGLKEFLIREGKDVETALIGGGTTSGLLALSLAIVLGFRDLALFGFDSSYAEGRGHAYPQPENDRDQVLTVTMRGHEFDCAPWMIRQAQEFQKLARNLVDEHDAELRVFGSGLIPTIAREMFREPPIDCATYEQGAAPQSYDFVAWMAIAKASAEARGHKGKLRIAFMPGPGGGFREDELPGDRDHRQAMVDRVMRPSLALFGAVEDNAALDGYTHEYTFRQLCELVRAGQAKAPMIKPPAAKRSQVRQFLGSAGADRAVTITLRESEHWTERNSDHAVWARVSEFLAGRGFTPIVIRDARYARTPLPKGAGWFGIQNMRASSDVQYRAALYAAAACNLFVSNGPAALAFLSRQPWLMFRPLCSTWRPGQVEWYARFHGIGPHLAGAEQFPWSTPAQRIVWNAQRAPDGAWHIQDGDDYAAIVAAFLEIEPLLRKVEP